MLKKSGLEELSEQEYADLCKEHGSESDKGGFDQTSFVRYMLAKAIDDEEGMYSLLNSWGYDESLYSFEERVFILTVHSETPGMKLTMRDSLNSGISNEISGLLIGSRGQ